MLGLFDFDLAFKVLTGHEPFPWQRRLFKRLSAGDLPPAVDIPTGLGKTSIMALWLLARAMEAPLPRRLAYVVDRRAVVDQATDFAEALRERLSGEALDQVRRGLGLDGKRLPISTLRGEYVDNREWLEDPAAPAIIVGTVDMIGSRLLFEGYGVSRRMRPYEAGLMGCDTLVMLDEAHLARPFERLLRSIEAGQRKPTGDGLDSVLENFSGSRANTACPPPFRVLPLSATLGDDASESEQLFTLNDEDWVHERVSARLKASKTLAIEDIDSDKIEHVLAERSWCLAQEEIEATSRPARVLVYCDKRTVAEKVADSLRKRVKQAKAETAVILFTGGRRVYEREEAAQQLQKHGLIAGSDANPNVPVFVVATAAGEVGVDLDADHMVCDLVAWERMVQRLGRVNRLGKGKARVLVIDQGVSEKKQIDEADISRRKAVRQLLKALPLVGSGHQAGPAALVNLGKGPGRREQIAKASTPTPLYPALTRPLIDAWAMTSLAEHSGRPEISPWLRGWVDDDPQTTVVWRRCLPVREGTDVEAFFNAAPPQTIEHLETETWRVVDWLKKRAGNLLETPETEAEGGHLLAPLNRDTAIAFLLGSGGKPEGILSLREAGEGLERKELQRRLGGRRLVVDARLKGLKEGLLDANHAKPVVRINGNGGDSEVWEGAAQDDIPEDVLPMMRVRVLADDARTRLMDERQALRLGSGEVRALPYQVSPEGEVRVWLVVERRRGEATDEESRAMALKVQRLEEHQEWTALEAGRIAEALNLAADDRAMLEAAARHHDDGKKAPRWQRAFNAPREGGPYAKTSGPLNRHVLNGYRHEFQSMLDAQERGLDGLDRSDHRFDLALHLIASHHGYARPAIGIEGCDTLPPTVAQGHAREIALRFARLQRQWGPWGLAWWEALLRAADQRASKALQEAVS